MANSKATEGQQFEIRCVIEKLGVSQRGLAKLLGKSLDWVGRIVRGQYSPSWPNAAVIAKTLGVSVGVFLEGDPARKAFFLYGKQEIIQTTGKATPGKPTPKKPASKKPGRKTEPSVN